MAGTGARTGPNVAPLSPGPGLTSFPHVLDTPAPSFPFASPSSVSLSSSDSAPRITETPGGRGEGWPPAGAGGAAAEVQLQEEGLQPDALRRLLIVSRRRRGDGTPAELQRRWSLWKKIPTTGADDGPFVTISLGGGGGRGRWLPKIGQDWLPELATTRGNL